MAMDASAEARMRATIAASNMEAIPLERAPKVAIYTPPNSTPWDDAVTMALEYAQIPYETIWDDDVIRGRLDEYEWLHLHHEDFTGQYSKFFITYAGSPWLQEEVSRNHSASRIGPSSNTGRPSGCSITAGGPSCCPTWRVSAAKLPSEASPPSR